MTYDLIVIGAGPGGYVAAIRAAQLGMTVACVEREALGGTCLNIGCIPSKALLESSHHYHAVRHDLQRHGVKAGSVELDLRTMMARKDEVVKGLTGGVGALFRKNKVEHVRGRATIVAPDAVEVRGDGEARRLTASRLLIATGSAPAPAAGLAFDGRFILSSTEALALESVPKRLLVIGGGYIGVEMGSVWSRLGSEVLVLEFLDRILPGSDAEMASLLHKSLEKQGLKFRFGATAERAEIADGKVRLHWKSAGGADRGVEEADRVLVCVGRRPMTEGLGLEAVGVKTDARGFIVVDEQFRTSVPSIHAIGDVIGGIMLAHKAEEEGVACAERMAGRAGHVNYAACPAVVYTLPELASVGMTEAQATARGAVKVGRFPLIANGRARGMGVSEGVVKIIADAATDRLLGVHILAAHASDMIAEAVVAMEFGGSAEDLARSFHAHPTLAEAVKEAALAVDGRAIHI